MKLTAAGYSLVEVLIALCILSAGLLGFAQAQLVALRINQMAYLQSIAQMRLLAMAETIQACAMIKCSATNLQNAMMRWNDVNHQLLPEGKGGLTAQNDYQSLTIKWQTNDDNHAVKQAKLLLSVFYN